MLYVLTDPETLSGNSHFMKVPGLGGLGQMETITAIGGEFEIPKLDRDVNVSTRNCRLRCRKEGCV